MPPFKVPAKTMNPSKDAKAFPRVNGCYQHTLKQVETWDPIADVNKFALLDSDTPGETISDVSPATQPLTYRTEMPTPAEAYGSASSSRSKASEPDECLWARLDALELDENGHVKQDLTKREVRQQNQAAEKAASIEWKREQAAAAAQKRLEKLKAGQEAESERKRVAKFQKRRDQTAEAAEKRLTELIRESKEPCNGSLNRLREQMEEAKGKRMQEHREKEERQWKEMRSIWQEKADAARGAFSQREQSRQEKRRMDILAALEERGL